ncbi:MAG: hypothetical protein ACR2NU_04710 [Aeoliella sp.]
MQFVAIILLCILSAVVYGIVHDQITARICIEYFTIGHPPIFRVPVESPTLIALAWGVIATWWVGLGLGILLACAARLGNRPPRDVGSFVRPIAMLLAITAMLAALAGVLGYFVARQGGVFLLEPLASRVPVEKHVPFITDLWAHSASYLIWRHRWHRLDHSDLAFAKDLAHLIANNGSVRPLRNHAARLAAGLHRG